MAQRNSEKAREVLTRVIASSLQIRTTKEHDDLSRHHLSAESGPTGSSRKPQPADSNAKS